DGVAPRPGARSGCDSQDFLPAGALKSALAAWFGHRQRMIPVAVGYAGRMHRTAGNCAAGRDTTEPDRVPDTILNSASASKGRGSTRMWTPGVTRLLSKSRRRSRGW